MHTIPILAFAAYSGTGKTTLIEKLIPALKSRGLRVAVIKHDAHSFEIDHEGKDSWRFARAGADIAVISSPEKTAYIEQRNLSFFQSAAMIHDVDLILAEGFKELGLTQIGICRQASGKGFTAGLDRYIAVVTDLTDLDTAIPRFGFADSEIPRIADFILKNMAGFTRLCDIL